MADGQPWWAGAVLYQIYPRSFADGDGDGVGDLAGIRARLDHVAWLGVDGVWLSPFYRSPMADFGYDVSDHCDVDPRFGTLADAEALIEEAHDRGLRVLVDFVPNHTSDRHPWFEASRSRRDDPRRDWYWWRDPTPDGGPPNNWRASFTGETRWVRDATGQLRPRWGLAPADAEGVSAWTLDPRTGQLYLHSFLPQQPDLDWHHPDVVAAQHDVLRFWLDRGVDGFRVDAVITLGKPAGLPDAIPELALLPEAGLTDERFTQAKVAELRHVLAGYGDDRVLLGEVGGIDVGAIGRYVTDDLFHLAFDFPPMIDRWHHDRWRRHIDEAHGLHGDRSWATWVLSNHDTPRHAERYGTEARARAAAVLLLGLRGTAVLYAGEELGLRDAEVAPGDALDPGHRDGCRAPIPWTPQRTDTSAHGWGTPTWLPFPSNAEGHDVTTERQDPASVLHLYRRLLTARRASPALRHGTFAWAESPAGVLAWHRRHPETGDERLVVVSFTDAPRHAPPPGPGWVVEVSSQGDGTEAGRRWDGHLRPDEAVITRRG